MSGRRRGRRAAGAGAGVGAEEGADGPLTAEQAACCVCRGVLVEPVVLPCAGRHRYCLECWSATAAEAPRCPLCRTRVGSWLRAARGRPQRLVHAGLWARVRAQYPRQLEAKRAGRDLALSDEKPIIRLSAPGEIRLEYEAELRRLRTERIQVEEKHSHETEKLVRSLQQEEDEERKACLERVKQDELLAKQLQETSTSRVSPQRVLVEARTTRVSATKRKAHRTTLDKYFIKKKLDKRDVPNQVENGTLMASFRYLSVCYKLPELNDTRTPIVTEDDATSTSSSVSSKTSLHAAVSTRPHDRPSPEVASNYRQFLNDYLDKKLRHFTMQKEMPGTVKRWPPLNNLQEAEKEFSVGVPKPPIRTKGAQKELCMEPSTSSHKVQSLPVSLPVSLHYTGFLSQKMAALAKDADKQCGSGETDSVDSMRQELCYFKPIHPTATSMRNKPNEPVRVIALRNAANEGSTPEPLGDPDLVLGLWRLRGELPAPSAFVCLLNFIQVNKAVCDISDVNSRNETAGNDALPYIKPPKSNIYSYEEKQGSDRDDGLSRPECGKKLRRTRSTGNIPKLVNESTPKKTHKRKKATSEKKSKSGSSGKKAKSIKGLTFSPADLPELPELPEPVIDYKSVNIVAKNQSSPFKVCDSMISNKEMSKKSVKNLNNCDANESNNNNSTLRKSKRKVSTTQVDKPVKRNAAVNGYMNASPLNNDPEILAHQVKLEQMLEQERKDLELALQVEAEWNGAGSCARYGLRRGTLKRQLTLTHMLHGAKKMKA